MRDENLRQKIVDRAYHDVVLSGDYSYRVFAEQVFSEALPDERQRDHRRLLSPALLWNRIDERLWEIPWWIASKRARHVALIQKWIREARWATLSILRRLLDAMVGAERIGRILARIRRRGQS
jgi:hypothetical protein